MISQVQSPADWRGEQLADSQQWRPSLTGAERVEVLAALAFAEDAGVALGAVSQRAFPLPTLGSRLQRLAGDVSRGRGFTLLRGIPVLGLDERQCEIVAVGIASYFGGLVPQGEHALPLLHVRDAGVDPASPSARSYQHNQGLGFHADPTDVVALLCIRPAQSGGESAIVSAIAVHNEIVRTRPDLAHILYESWWFDRRSGDGPDSFYERPVYAVAGGSLVTHYGPDYMRSAQRGAHVPPLTRLQAEAMEVLDGLNRHPRFMLTMDMVAGDMQFLNNRVVLHSRTAYVDYAEPERRRDLIRLWLSGHSA